MIRRENWKVTNEYLDHLDQDRQLGKLTVKNIRIGMRLLLEYADDKTLDRLDGTRPTLPEYIATHKSERTGKPLAVVTQQKALEHIRGFYTWARIYKRGAFSKVKESWVDLLKVRRSLVNASKERGEHEFWRFEDIMKVVEFPPESLKDERTRAAILFMFLSGMRITAFVSLPVDCVDMERRRVEQKPSRGVLTKNRKAAVTFLLPIEEMLTVVRDWDAKVRSAGGLYWFSILKLSEVGEYSIDGRENKERSFQGRRSLLDGDIRELCVRLDVPVLSAHKLRHSHAVYGLRHSNTVEEFKAVSQNLMHANIGITDGIYGVLPEENVSRVIGRMGEGMDGSEVAEVTEVSAEEVPAEVLKLARLLMKEMGK